MAGTNPFDSIASSATPKNPFDSMASPASSGNPFDSVVGKARGAAGNVMHAAGDVLDFQRAKTQEAIFHGGSSDENRARLRKAIGIGGLYDHAADPGNGPEWTTHLLRGITDTALDTATDPLTYETMGGSLLAKGGKALLGLGARGLEVATKAPVIGQRVAAAREGAQAIGNAAQDYFTHGGAAARLHGQGAVDFAMGADAKTSARAAEIDRRLQASYQQIRSHLTDAEFGEALQVRNGERQAYTNEGRLLISPKAAAAADALKRLTKSAYALRADESGQRRIANYLAEPRPATAKTVIAQRKPAKTYDMSSLEGLADSFRHDTDRFMQNDVRAEPLEQLSMTEDMARSAWDHYVQSGIPHERLATMAPAERDAARSDYIRAAMADGDTTARPGELLSDGGRAIVDKTPRKRTVVRAPSTPYELPPELQEFAGQPGTLSSQQYRRDYVPGPREAKADVGDREASSYNRLDPFDPNAERRESITIDPAQHELYDQAFRGSLANAARQVGASELRKELKDRFGGALPQEIDDLFKVHVRATGAERTIADKALDAWRGVIALPKGAIVGMSPRHMFNIADLLSQHSLRAIPEAAVTAAKLLKDPERRYEILKRGIELGAVGGESAERATPVADFLNRLGPVAKLGGGMKKMNDATWAFDDAAAQALALRKARDGMQGYAAGRTARKNLVDYNNTSKFTEHMKNVLPFATFNTSVPGAVGSALLKNPARMEAINRATGGAYLGDEPEIGGHRLRFYGPTSEIGGGDVAGFARKSLAAPIRGAADLAGITAEGKRHYFTYGQDLHDPKALASFLTQIGLSGIPMSDELLSALGLSAFKPEDLRRSVMRTSTGLDVK